VGQNDDFRLLLKAMSELHAGSKYNGRRKIIAQERVRYARTAREGLPEMGKVCEDSEKKPHP
jgi:hypothetical protein